MNPQEKIDLKKLIGKMDDYEDNTHGIREMKHSDSIRADILKIEELKKEHADLRNTDAPAFSQLCESECIFLFYKYTDIYNRLLKDEVDLNIMHKALDVLKRIENEEIDQQEGSVIVGKLFHEIYVDSALRRSANLDAAASSDARSSSAVPPKVPIKKISWREYKKSRETIISNLQN
jgi:hypothetical protein